MRLGLDQDEGEKWIVNLIRDTRVDAKIDYKDGTVVMNHPPQSVYQQVIERTKGGFFRTQVLRYHNLPRSSRISTLTSLALLLRSRDPVFKRGVLGCVNRSVEHGDTGRNVLKASRAYASFQRGKLT